MEYNNKVAKIFARNQIISSIVWAGILLACSFNLENSSKEITYIIISGFFVEFLRMNSTHKEIKTILSQKETEAH